MPTHYDTLRVDPRASAQRVRAAYRRMAQKFHPDKHAGRGDAAAIMSQINLAYSVLSDVARRAAYDEQLQREHPQSTARTRRRTGAAAMQDRFGWSGWLVLAIASITVLTLGFVALRMIAPQQPAFRAPMAATAQTQLAESTPLAPVPAIQPWVEPARTARPVNEATEPVARLVRDGVIAPQSRPAISTQP
ncbi:MAG: J domain-containing protein [Ramlibacter sp.]